MDTAVQDAPEVAAALRELRADATHGTPLREPAREFKSLGALRAVFDVLDPLSELLAQTLDGWQTPMVMVFVYLYARTCACAAAAPHAPQFGPQFGASL